MEQPVISFLNLASVSIRLSLLQATLILRLASYVGYPNSVLNGRQGANGLFPNAAAKLEGAAPARRTTHIKIESPSVAAAAKKAAAEVIEDDLPDGESSSTSDENTLVCKSKSSKACSGTGGTGGDVALSPTKSKL